MGVDGTCISTTESTCFHPSGSCIVRIFYIKYTYSCSLCEMDMTLKIDWLRAILFLAQDSHLGNSSSY
jgi:hypothetical protein